MNLFSMELDKIHLGNHVRLFEAFSGIGTQAMALKRLGVNVEHIGFSEIDKYAIQSYVAIHGDVKNYGDITKMTEIPPCDIFTWSFPCTDLSKAGKQKGLDGTRSGLAYEVIRLLKVSNKPKVLLMENVPDLLGSKFRDGWQEIYHEIESLGYTNYVEVLNAKNYGVAQNRDRVFMVSILGEYAYEFPKPFKLEKRLKDYLEDEVDEKYYLSEKLLNFFVENSKKNQDKGNGFKFKPHTLDDDKPAYSITTNTGNRMDDNFISIPEATKQGYALAKDGDGVYINRPHQKRDVVQKGMIQTLKTSGDDVGVVDNLRIRKLTPLECWRLMGIDDEDFYKAQSVVSNSQLYKQAGNSIVVDVLVEIFRGLL